MRAPSNGLDGSLVFTPLKSGLGVEFLPHHELVVVASRGELSILLVPLETTDFLLVTDKLAKPLLWLSDVAMVDCAVS